MGETRIAAWGSTRGASGRRSSGFTLLELMIVVGIIAILAALAIAGYGFAMQKSRRGAAQGCLGEHAQFMERYYTTTMSYVGAPNPQCTDDVEQYYTVGFTAAPIAREFTLEAVPIATGPQADDQCGTMSINQIGEKLAEADDCW